MASKLRKLKVAVVDSSRERVEHLASVIRGTSYLGPLDVVTAGSGNEACRLFDSSHPDLFIINSQITGIPSRDVCRWIRANEAERHTGIIFLSSASGNADQLSVDCLTQGADDFLRENCSSEELLARIHTVLRLKFMTDDLRKANYRLRMLTLTDELTGMANMRCFKERFQKSSALCQVGTTGLAVIMLDLDNFKMVNDRQNHLVGSHVISEAGKLIMESTALDEGDLPARYGGDEFIICCEVSEMEFAVHKAMKIREEIEAAEFQFDGCKVKLTSSVGVSWAAPGFSGRESDIIKLADVMLYRSKEFGRNRVSSMELLYPIDFDQVGSKGSKGSKGSLAGSQRSVVGGANSSRAVEEQDSRTKASRIKTSTHKTSTHKTSTHKTSTHKASTHKTRVKLETSQKKEAS